MSFSTEYAAGWLGTYVLGAAQLGSSYGIANAVGKPDAERAWEILNVAVDVGVRVIDTAQAYGDSESVIGAYLERHPECPLHIITKLAGDVRHDDPDAVNRAVRESRARVGRSLAAVLLHDASKLQDWEHGLASGLAKCIDEGIVSTLGVSIYTPSEFSAALEIEDIRIIQAPFNALDRRLLDTGLLARALDSGRIVILRSIFLQGLLLLEEHRVPPHLGHTLPDLKRWHAVCQRFGISPLAAAVGYVRSAVPRALLVLGSELPEQVRANAHLMSAEPLSDEIMSAISELPPCDEKVVNPSLWGRA